MKIKSYIILGIHRQTGKIVGEIENSFTIGHNDRYVRVYRKQQNEQPKEIVDELIEIVNDRNKSHPEYNWNVFRVGSKNCPIKISWRYIAQLKKKLSKYHKFHYRNLPFIVK